VHPDDLAATTVEASQAEKAGNTTFENRYRCKDGSYRWLRWSSTPYADTELIYATARDVTDQKLVDQALARQAEELSRSNSDLEQFAYVASHDLQEPLRAIGGFTQLLDRKYGPQLDDQARTYIGHTVEATARMETLIKDLLAYSRVQRKGGTLDAVDLNVILDRALQALSSAISQASAVISRDTLPTIIADPTQMGQLLQNLVGNALKFRNDGQAHVEIRAERHDDGWLFSVRDDGIGIDPAFTDRIFAIFQRLHTRTEYSGTGIGLAICKRIVERHGGRIWVESAEGAGCTFRFTVPDANGGER
jgi:light-regulated signal transduction histidine kinase (bacteriophytochrome)